MPVEFCVAPVSGANVDFAPRLQAALAKLDPAQGGAGGTLRIPSGTYTLKSGLVVPHKVSIEGDGAATVLLVAHGGDGITIPAPPNSSTAVRVRIVNMEVRAAPGFGGLGNGIVDQCGTFVHIENVIFSDFKVGVVFTQTELSDIISCDFEACTRAGVWLVDNGFVNRISVQRCQFNGCLYGVIDDGGTGHSYRDNNFNGCGNMMYLAGVNRGTLDGNVVENCGAVWMDFQRQGTTHGVGQCIGVTFVNNIFSMGYTNVAVLVYTGTFLNFSRNSFAGVYDPISQQAVAVLGVVNSARLYERESSCDSPGFAALDSYPLSGSAESYHGATPTLTNLQWRP